ncbi:hypothetical protein FGO68_gene12961 [Halteria grandinella]|uniref:Uncharacterized protein n=1 Tax=Halteria grandinella TaxID=5974 RepID=A0A8J8NNM4_HALGN|nr:hypothetical protein FGO68_gene12961 [Halteria grandinella]
MYDLNRINIIQMSNQIINEGGAYQVEGTLNETLVQRDINIIMRHVEKVHYQIEVDDVTFIDKLASLLAERGGLLYYDEQGKKYLFYLVKSKETQEMCLLHEQGCNLKDKISYNSGQEELSVTGMIHYQNLLYGSLNQNLEIQQVSSVRNFLIADNLPFDNNAVRNQVTQNYQKIKKQFKAPYYFINTDISLESADLAFSEIGKILKNANEQTTGIFSTDNAAIILVNMLSIGILSNSLLCFWLIMETQDWDFKIYWQILIYIGFIIATLVGEVLIFAALINLYAKFENVFTAILLGAILFLIGPVETGLFIWKLVTSIQNPAYSQYLWSLITFVIQIPVCFFIYWGVKSKTWNEEANARILQYKKFRLNQ